MNTFTKLARASAIAVAMLSSVSASAVTFTYVGKWAVADGPLWSGSPPPQSLSGRQTAALLFGGLYTDYAISTIDSNPLNINFLAKLDGYGDTQYLTSPAGQDFVGIVGPNYAFGPGNYSAYVYDHACGRFYCAGGGGEAAINYAFRVSDVVPEPASWGLMVIGFGMVGAGIRRRKLATA